MKAQNQVLVTDTTMRDAHQSLLATRMRTYDIAGVASAYANGLPQASVAGMLGRRHLRRGDALPERGPVGAAGHDPREGAQHPHPDAAARRQWRGLHQLSRQCGEGIRTPHRRCGHGFVPHLRLPQLGREYARRHRRGVRGGQAGGRGDLLHRRHLRSRPRQIRPGLLREAWRRSWRRPAATSWRSRTWRGCSSRPRRACWSAR